MKLRCSEIAQGLFILNIWKSVEHKLSSQTNLKILSVSKFCQYTYPFTSSLTYWIVPGGWEDLDFEHGHADSRGTLPTQSPISGKAWRLILSKCLKHTEVKQVFKYRCQKYVYGCCWLKALNALTVCHLMLLANDTLHLGFVRNNNEIVVLNFSCHNGMILCSDSAQLCEPGSTTYISEAFHWSPGVLKSAFRMKSGTLEFLRDGKDEKDSFWELEQQQKKPIIFLEIICGKVNPEKSRAPLKIWNSSWRSAFWSCWFRDGPQGHHFLQVQ